MILFARSSAAGGMAVFIMAFTIGAMGPPGSSRSLKVSFAIPAPGPAALAGSRSTFPWTSW